MAGVFKRATDKARGKAGKWTCWWRDAVGRKRQCAGTADKATSLEIARRREADARLVREGILDPRDLAAREAGGRPLEAHVRDYRAELIGRGGGLKHADATASALRRLLADAGIASIAGIAARPLRTALGRWNAEKSGRTANHALAAVRAFAKWLHATGALKEDPLLSLRQRYNEQVSRKRVRRELTVAELARLLEAAAGGPGLVARRPHKSKHLDVVISGIERAVLYRVAMGTGFRASELASLTPESFALDGPEPTITVTAAYTKNKKAAVQPIRRELADLLGPWLARKPPGAPVLVFPVRTAQMLRVDLAAAGIPYRTGAGVVDFHALRHSYITHLIQSGADPKTVQVLARHSTITLTIDRYSRTNDELKRRALEGK